MIKTIVVFVDINRKISQKIKIKTFVIPTIETKFTDVAFLGPNMSCRNKNET